MKDKVVISIVRKTGALGQRLPSNMALLLELRAWCRDNAKYPWKTYHLQQTEYVDFASRYDFIVFEFDDPKDAMLFRLYTGK